MMKRDAIEELYDYTGFAWAALMASLRKLPDGTLTQAAPGSGWPSLREALLHVLGSYDGWLHEDLGLGKLIDPPAETMTTLAAFDEYRQATRDVFLRVLNDTPDVKLFETFTKTYDEEDGPETLSIGDICTNLLLHERGHHGDFTTLLWQLGAKQPFLDYRMYVYLKRNPDSPLRPPGW